MFFHKTAIEGAYLIEIDPRRDDRGYFARTSCVDELKEHGLDGDFLQQSISWNPLQGTLRGMHFQAAPNFEDKLVRVTRGSCFDVFFDMRPNSPSYGKWHGEVLTADNHRSFYIPKGCAHGYQILEPNTEVFYQMTVRYLNGTAKGIAWDDPDLAITWPQKFDVTDRRLLSEVDSRQPSWREVQKNVGL
jgi:dTDP-4-dehydrorhamnose 3,5-epimerase